jgi:riboflavin biosynthesis pyrimidine reductase
LQPKNQLAKQFALTPSQMIEEISTNFNTTQISPINLLIEAGPNLLLQMVKQGLVDHLYLTINQQAVGENSISISELTDSFELISSEELPPCQFNYYKRLTK